VPAGVDKVANALTRTLADERGKWLLDGNHVAAVCEYPLSGVVGGELVVRVSIERLIDEDGTRWIVDYKAQLA